MVRYVSKYVVCPFYHNEDKLTMYCEGVISEATLLNTFRSLSDKGEYKAKFCCSMDGHKKCPIAEYLYRKYDEQSK